MPMRITGLASGLDVDSVVKESMQPFRIKIDKQGQQRDIVKIKQQLYRDVINDSRELYEKYLSGAGENNLLLQKNWGSTKFTSGDPGVVSVTGLGGAKAENYSVKVESLASTAKATLTDTDMVGKDEITVSVTVGGTVKTIKVSTKKDDATTKTKTEIIDELNASLKTAGSDINASYSDFSKGIVLETKAMGVAAKFTVEASDTDDATLNKTINAVGKDLKATLTKNGEVEPHLCEGISNSVTLDGVQFKFTGVSEKTGAVDADGKDLYKETSVIGTNDTGAMADKIMGFMDKYNSLITKINTLTLEKRNREYVPLTTDQKKDMSEDEIKLWETKVKQGQLHNDSDLTRIANGMKSCMETVLGSNVNLEKIGFTYVKDYTTKNGTYTIEKDKLAKALEDNSEGIMEMFVGNGTSSNTGILKKLNTVLFDETVTTQASLLKKAGIENSSTASNNTLSKSIEEYNKKIYQLEGIFSTKEQALYSKYAKLESIMNNLNSQQSYLSQQLGLS